MVPSGSTDQPASRARAARTSFMSARAGRLKLPYWRRPASMRLVMARRWRSRSLVRSFSFSRSLRPGLAAAAAAAAKPRGRRWGGGGWGRKAEESRWWGARAWSSASLMMRVMASTAASSSS